MAASLQTLIPLVSSIALLLTMANARSGKKTSFAYNFNGGGLTYQGAANFPTSTDGSTYLRLTKTDDSGNAQKQSVGRVVYTKPVLFWRKKKQADFETTVKFIIRPSGDGSPADGLVFFIAPVNSSVGQPGGSFGVFDSSGKNPSVFAVEFDIFSNQEYSDPSTPHVGIDIQSAKSRNTTEVGDAIVGQEVSARIAYDAATKLISVHGGSASNSFEVSYVYDLRKILPQHVQVGISAATGELVAVHDVIAWSFHSKLVKA